MISRSHWVASYRLRSGGCAGMRKIPISIFNPSQVVAALDRIHGDEACPGHSMMSPTAMYNTVLARYITEHKIQFSSLFACSEFLIPRIGYGHIGLAPRNLAKVNHRAPAHRNQAHCGLVHSWKGAIRAGFRVHRLRGHRRGPDRRHHARSPETTQCAEPRDARRVGLGVRTSRGGRRGSGGAVAGRRAVVFRGARPRLLHRRARTLAWAGAAPHLSVQRRDVRRSGVTQPRRSGTTSSRTPSGGAISARSLSPRSTEWSCPRA